MSNGSNCDRKPQLSDMLTVPSIPVHLGFPFAKLLRNFCGTKRKIFLSLRIIFARKNNNCAKIEFRFMRNFRKKYFRKTHCVSCKNSAK